MEELKKFCRAEAERAKQLRIDQLCIQDKESQSTVNHFTVEIQELQDKVNSLNDSREFFDPETASRSGMSHVASERVSIPSRCGMLSRDSCLQLDTRNSFGASGHFFLKINLHQMNRQWLVLEIFKKSCKYTLRARVSEH